MPNIGVWRVFAWVLAGFAGLASPLAAQATIPTELPREPAPAFVIDIEPVAADAAALAPVNGAHTLLLDLQHSARGEDGVTYTRTVVQPVTQAGLPLATQMELLFEPGYTDIALNHVRVLRDGVWEDRSERIRTTFAQREPYLAYGILTGQISAIVRLGDIRVGDVVDVAVTTITRSGRLGGRQAYFFHPELLVAAVERLHFRSEWNRGEANWAAVPDLGGIVHSRRGNVEIFQRPAAPFEPPVYEDSLPDDEIAYPILSVTDFANWAEVVEWGIPYYQRPETPDPEVVEIATRIRTEHSTAQDQALAALRFVQDEIQYFALVMGEGGYTPQPVSETLFNRSGDCKAKVALLLALFDQLGFSGHAVFTGSSGRVVDRLPANPAGFDHVIVRLQLDGETYWLDPTHSLQGGDLAGQQPPAYGYGLVLEPGVTDLTALPELRSDTLLSEFVESFDATGGAGAPATVSLVYTARHVDADLMRRALDQFGTAQFEEFYTNLYGGRFDAATVTQPLDIEDDRLGNEITIRIGLSVEGLFQRNDTRRRMEMNAGAHLMPVVLPRIDPQTRVRPVAVLHPTHTRHVTHIRLPGAPKRSEYELDDTFIETGIFTYRQDVDLVQNLLTLDHVLRTQGRSVPSDDIAAVYEAYSEATDAMRYRVYQPLPRE